jgi:hypothetical protein
VRQPAPYRDPCGWLAWQPEFHNIQIRDIKAFGDRVGSEQGGDAVCARAWAPRAPPVSHRKYLWSARTGAFLTALLDDLRDAEHP